MSLTKKRIKKVFANSLENVRDGKKPNVSGEMLKEGYSESSSRALKVTRTKTWQQLLALINDEALLTKLTDIALDDDKRASIAAIVELMKLKDKYPANKMKVSQYQEELNGL